MASFLTPAGAQVINYLQLLAQASDLYRRRKYREASNALQEAVDCCTTTTASSSSSDPPSSDQQWQQDHGRGLDRFWRGSADAEYCGTATTRRREWTGRHFDK